MKRNSILSVFLITVIITTLYFGVNENLSYAKETESIDDTTSVDISAMSEEELQNYIATTLKKEKTDEELQEIIEKNEANGWITINKALEEGYITEEEYEKALKINQIEVDGEIITYTGNQIFTHIN